MLTIFFWMCGLPFECGQPTRSHTQRKTNSVSQQLSITNISLARVGFCVHFPSPCWSGLRLYRSCEHYLKCCEFLHATGMCFLVKAIICRRPSNFQLNVSVFPNMTQKQEVKTKMCLCERFCSWPWVYSINGSFYPYSFNKLFQAILRVNNILRTEKTLSKSRANKNTRHFSTVGFILGFPCQHTYGFIVFKNTIIC